jgi:hypothetical protein
MNNLFEPTSSGDDSAANQQTVVPAASPNPTVDDANEPSTTPNNNTGDDSAANEKNDDATGDADTTHTRDVSAAIKDSIDYTVSIPDAQTRHAKAHRKVPSDRTLQRHCQNGLILAIQVSVTYDDGTHAKPWMMNERSLDMHIEKQPLIVLDVDAANKQTSVSPPAPNPTVDAANEELTPPVAPASAPTSPEKEVVVTKTPQMLSLQDLLLQQAKLETKLEMTIEAKDAVIKVKDEMISDLKDTRDNMLQTIETIATTRSLPAPSNRPDNVTTNVIMPPSQEKPRTYIHETEETPSP